MPATSLGMGSVSPHDANKLFMSKGFSFIDVRSKDEYDWGHVHGSVHIPFSTISMGGFVSVKNKNFIGICREAFKLDSPILVIGKNAQQSKSAAEDLRSAGFTQVLSVDGGIMAFAAVCMLVKTEQ